MSTGSSRTVWPRTGRAPRAFALLFGGFLGLILLKFGNPPIMEKWVTPPANIYEFVLGFPWPISWAYVLLAGVTVFGIFSGIRQNMRIDWLLGVPLAWLVWQIASAGHSVAPALSWPTVAHFVAAVVCFYLGFFCLRTEAELIWLAPGLLLGLALVVGAGWEQHFGGLEQTRRYFYLYIYPQMKEVPPEYLKKMASTRIFGTLFYPNALAGALLIGVPSALGFVYKVRNFFTPAAYWFLALLLVTPAFACLYWSGSKGGWLLMLLLGLVALFRLPFANRLKLIITGLVLVVGLAGFFWKYSAFFQKGATSVTARFDYWSAAVKTVGLHPVFGTGPGTFARPYERLKLPQAEMTRLVHNDYIEQASDSGIPGFLAYLAFIVGGLACAYPRQAGSQSTVQGAQMRPGRAEPATGLANTNWFRFALWVAVLGWALQSLFEFSLYIPALAWLAFAILGALVRMAHEERLNGALVVAETTQAGRSRFAMDKPRAGS